MHLTTRELFQKHRLRCTTQRLALYEALSRSHCHPTAEELYRIVKANAGGQHISRATVYNTLDALCRAGLARQLAASTKNGSGNGGCRYDADLSEHLHFRCEDSAEVRDIPVDLSRKLMDNLPAHVIAEIERHLGVHVDRVSMQLIGRSDPTKAA